MPRNEGFSGIRILFVTSDTSGAKSARSASEPRAFGPVRTADSAAAAMQSIREDWPDAVLLRDEDGLDALALVQAIRAHAPALPVVLLVESGRRELIEPARRAGITEHLFEADVAGAWPEVASLLADLATRADRHANVLQTQHRQSTAIDDAPDVVGIVRNGRWVSLNRTGMERLGSPPRSTVEGEPIAPWVETERAGIGAVLEGVGGDGPAVRTVDGHLVREDGRRLPVVLTLAAISWDGRPATALIARDRADNGLVLDPGLKTRAFDAAPIGIAIADATRPDNPLVYVNERTQSMTGYDAEAMLGRNCRFLQGPETDPERVAEVRAAIAEARPVTVQLRNYREDGTVFWNRLSIAPIRDGETVTHFVGFQQDVTDEKNREQSLDRFKRAVEAAGHAIYVTDADGEIEYVNPAFESITGYDREEAVGRTPSILKSGAMGPEYYEALWETITDGGIWEEALINQRQSGERYRVEQTIAPIVEDGEPTAFVAIQTDVTERERLEDRVEIALTETDSVIFEIDTLDGQVFAKSGEASLFGSEGDRVEGRNSFLETMVHPRDTETFESAVSALQSGVEEDVSLDVRTDEEPPRWLRCHLFRNEDQRIVGLAQDITERKTREQTLRQYEQAVESSKDLLFALDPDFSYLFANQAYRQYHGLGDTDVTERQLSSVLDPATFERLEGYLQTALHGRPVQTQMRREHPRRGKRVFDIRLFPLEGPEGAVNGVGASMRDITEKREHQAAVEHESELRRVLSAVNQSLVRAPDVETALERTTEIIGGSTAFGCALTSLQDSTVATVNCTEGSELTEADVRGVHDTAYREAVFEAGTLEIEDVTAPPYEQHPSGAPSHAGIAVSLDHDGDRYGVLTVHLLPGSPPTGEAISVLETVASDVGYFVANEELRQRHRRIAEIVERIDDPVMLQDRAGNFRIVNQALIEFAGLDREQLLGADESAFMDAKSAERIERKKATVLAEESPVAYQVSPTFPDGRERTFSTVRYPSQDGTGEIDGTMAICRDVTELEDHQRQLRVLDRVLRHNVSNDMNVVRGYAEMIRNDGPAEFADHAEKIIASSDKLLSITAKQRKITEFLATAKANERVDLGAVSRRVVGRLRQTYPEVAISIEAPESAPVWVNPAIEEALEELLANSIEHRDRRPPNPAIVLDVGEEIVEVRVRDDNPRIPAMDRAILAGEGELDRLRHGSGLGLWLVKLVVDHSNGELAYEAGDPRGNAVTISLNRP